VSDFFTQPAAASSDRQIRVCAECGLLTPTALPRCRECGAMDPQLAARYRERERASRFVEAVFLRRSPFTYIFFGANIAFFVLMAFSGGSTDPGVLQAFGANSNELVKAGEYWRLIAPIFLHIGILHLACNMQALWVLGPQIESLYGSARFVTVYILSGVGGFVANYFFSSPVSGGAGASGAIFGLLGLFLAFALRYRNEIPPLLLRSMRRGLILSLGVNLAITFAIPLISKSGHLGGLITGLLAGFIVPYARPGERRTGAVWIVTQVFLLSLVAASFAVVFLRYDGQLVSWRAFHWRDNVVPGYGRLADALSLFIEVSNEGERTFLDIQRKLSKLPPKSVAPPELKTSNAAARRRLERLGKWDPGADALAAQMLTLLQEQAALLETPHDPARLQDLEKKFQAYVQAQKNWIENDGRKYNLQLEEQPSEPAAAP
jgi:MYXO-CTERM domain-containing protein